MSDVPSPNTKSIIHNPVRNQPILSYRDMRSIHIRGKLLIIGIICSWLHPKKGNHPNGVNSFSNFQYHHSNMCIHHDFSLSFLSAILFSFWPSLIVSFIFSLRFDHKKEKTEKYNADQKATHTPTHTYTKRETQRETKRNRETETERQRETKRRRDPPTHLSRKRTSCNNSLQDHETHTQRDRERDQIINTRLISSKQT